jgi:hypothetical protein
VLGCDSRIWNSSDWDAIVGAGRAELCVNDGGDRATEDW